MRQFFAVGQEIIFKNRLSCPALKQRLLTGVYISAVLISSKAAAETAADLIEYCNVRYLSGKGVIMNFLKIRAIAASAAVFALFLCQSIDVAADTRSQVNVLPDTNTNIFDESMLAELSEITEMAESYGGNISVYYNDTETGYYFYYNPDETYKSASTIKAIYCQYIIQSGADLDEKIKFTSAVKKIGNFIPGIPVPTPIFIAIICMIIIALVLRFTKLGLFTQSVGINAESSRLNGINPEFIKFITYVILGLCVAVAGFIKVSRFSTINYSVVAKDIEMDAILAVALGGNALSGGKFNMAASILGAYVIQFLTTTLFKFNVISSALPAYKAVVVIILVVLSAPVVRDKLAELRKKLSAPKAAVKEANQ